MAGLKFTLELKSDGSRVVGVDAGDIVCKDKVEWARGCLSAFIGAGGVFPQVKVGERLCLPGAGGGGDGCSQEVRKEHVFPCSGYYTGVCVTCCGLGRVGEGVDPLVAGGRACGFSCLCAGDEQCSVAEDVVVSVDGDGPVLGTGKHAKRNRARREKAKLKKQSVGRMVEGDGGDVGVTVAAPAGFGGAGLPLKPDLLGVSKVSFKDVTTVEEQRAFARQWYERRKKENALAIQRADYNYKRNAYLDRARISEKRWEQERLTCEQKLANITEARFGSKPGYAETLASISDGSELPPSLSTGSDSPANLSDGTVSPNSSMSVAEENRLKKKVEELSGKVKEMELREVAFCAGSRFSKGHAEVENGKIHVYDGSGQYVPPSLSGASQPSVCFSDYL